MEFKWDEYLKAVTDASAAAALEKLQTVGAEAAKEGVGYAVKQYELIKKYTEQKATGKISEEEYQSMMLDLVDVMKLEALRANLASRKIINDLATTCLDIAVNCLSALVVL